MPRIAGVDLPMKKKVFIALTSLYGVGRSSVQGLLDQARVDGDKRVFDLTNEEVGRIQKVLEAQFIIEGTLRQKIREDIERLKRIVSYRGTRHAKALPVRGQRTRTNARSNRGKRRTVGAMTKEMAAKLETAKKTK